MNKNMIENAICLSKIKFILTKLKCMMISEQKNKKYK